MDAFESIAAKILEQEGYWVRQSVKIEDLTADEKESIRSRSIPTPEIDLVAFKEKTCVLFEVKSFLDSTGVTVAALKNPQSAEGKRYILLNSRKYQKLAKQKIIESFNLPKNTIIKFGLIAGEIKASDLDEVEKYCEKKGFILYKPSDIVSRVIKLGSGVYINDEVTMTVKLLRNAGHLIFNKEFISELIKDLNVTDSLLKTTVKELKKGTVNQKGIQQILDRSNDIKNQIQKLKKDLSGLKRRKKKKAVKVIKNRLAP